MQYGVRASRPLGGKRVDVPVMTTSVRILLLPDHDRVPDAFCSALSAHWDRDVLFGDGGARTTFN